MRYAGLISVMIASIGWCGEGHITVEAECNKCLNRKGVEPEYVCGEPVLIRTLVCNPSNRDFVGRSGFYAWGASFTMYVARGGEDLVDIESPVRKRRWSTAQVPTHFEPWIDRRMLPGTFGPGERAERIDMLIFPEPGSYRLKVVLKDKDRNGTSHESQVISFKVVSAPESVVENLSGLGGANFIINVGSTIFYAHYTEELCGGFPPGKSLMPKEFEKIAPVFRGERKESFLREYVIYADIMVHGRVRVAEWPLVKSRKVIAEQFAEEYSDSWLLAAVYKKLFNTYVADREREKAAKILKQIKGTMPHAILLKRIREKGGDIVEKMEPSARGDIGGIQEDAYQTKREGDDGGLALPIGLVVGAAGVVGVAIAGGVVLVVLLRRKPRAK